MQSIKELLSDVTIKTENEDDYRGEYLIQPLMTGYGHTLGNSLRRILLSSLSGAAITQVKIDDVQHQFSTIKGVVEDVVQINLNLKQVRLKMEDKEEATLTLSADKEGVVTAGDFEVPAGVTIINPELVIATLSGKDAQLHLEAKVEIGRGYKISDDSESKEVGLIQVDSLFTPIKKVNYRVEPIRVGRYANFDKLTLEVETDGTIAPFDAIQEAARILVDSLEIFVNPTEAAEKDEKAEKDQTTTARQNRLNRMSLEELELPTRLANSLRRGDIETVADLLERTPEDLGEISNVGEKSVQLIKETLDEHDLSLKDKA